MNLKVIKGVSNTIYRNKTQRKYEKYREGVGE